MLKYEVEAIIEEYIKNNLRLEIDLKNIDRDRVKITYVLTCGKTMLSGTSISLGLQ